MHFLQLQRPAVILEHQFAQSFPPSTSQESNAAFGRTAWQWFHSVDLETIVSIDPWFFLKAWFALIEGLEWLVWLQRRDESQNFSWACATFLFLHVPLASFDRVYWKSWLMDGVLSLRHNAGRISSALLDSPKFQVLGTPNETPLCYHLCQDALAKLFVWKPAWSHLTWHSDPPAAHHRKIAGSSKRHPHSTSKLLQSFTIDAMGTKLPMTSMVDEILVCQFLEIYDSRTPHVCKASLTQGGRIVTKFLNVMHILCRWTSRGQVWFESGHRLPRWIGKPK